MIYLREALAGLVSPWVVASPSRFSRQLRQFAHTELYTHHDIAAVARRQQSPLREEMLRHADDEKRHYGLFLEWARQVSPYTASSSSTARRIDEDVVARLVEEDAAPHRRLTTLFQYMAYVFLSESRAVLQFQLTRLFNLHDRRCRERIPLLLVDERRHVAYSLRVARQEFARAPWTCSRQVPRVLLYIARQDLVDLLKLVQTVLSGLMTAVLYYGVVTPWGVVQRLLLGLRRGRLRDPPPPAAIVLGDDFWQRP